ncbi:MAG: hypothetical protein PHI97_33710 [Desulfobulbus sp.]|nr:hypothetical protein [Desulfobulbus sp.]
MNGKCPRCAYKAPVICFVDAAEYGAMMQAFSDLPYEVQKPFLKYLSLFKPASGCAIQSAKAERLTRDLVALVAKGYVSEHGKADRPCPPGFWVMGMERMQELAGTLDLPMKNHNYLRSIVYKLANQADAQREQHQRRQEVDGSQRLSRQPTEDGMSEIMRKYLAQHGVPHESEQERTGQDPYCQEGTGAE